MRDDILTAYRNDPMGDGDALLVLEELHVVTELTGLADRWDGLVCRNLATVVRELGSCDVQLAIARRDGVLRDRDERLLTDLQEELAASGVTVRPLIALPAAA